MPSEIYELVALAARYWFLFLMVIIVWRSWRWYRKDKRQAKKRLKLLPDAGYVGEMIVLKGSDHLPRGTALPVPREGTLGLSRSNDLCIPVAGVAKRHLWFRFENERGLMVEPYGKNPVTVDGKTFEHRHEPLRMAHGSFLYAGECELRLRLFAGFEASGHAMRQRGVEDVEQEEESPQYEQMPGQEQQIAYQQWMQQQWMMQQYAQQQAYQQGYQQAMMQQAAMQEAPEEEAILFDENEADVYAYEAAREQGLLDDRAFMRPAGEKKPELPVYEEPAPRKPEKETVFYAPVMDDEPLGWDDDPSGEEDATDAALPKSAYVGHDEAERAKRQVWDKYFGGGPR